MIQSCKLSTALEIAEINTNIVESNPPSEVLTSAVVGNLFTQCQRVVRKTIRYVTIHFQDRSGAAALHCKNHAKINDPFVNRSLIRYGFCVGAQAIGYSVDIHEYLWKQNLLHLLNRISPLSLKQCQLALIVG